MSSSQDSKPQDNNGSLDEAMDRSNRELKLLANFYHQHGYLDRAQEIYKTVLKIQDDRNEDEV
jgi:lipopolysaccharide biosynthesis regulator YciM